MNNAVARVFCVSTASSPYFSSGIVELGNELGRAGVQVRKYLSGDVGAYYSRLIFLYLENLLFTWTTCANYNF